MLPLKTSYLYLIGSLLMLSMTVAEATALKDPTRPAAYAGQQHTENIESSDLVLNSVVKAGHDAIAVINNNMYKVGARVQGVRIKYIGDSYVKLADGRQLNLFQSVKNSKGNIPK